MTEAEAVLCPVALQNSTATSMPCRGVAQTKVLRDFDLLRTAALLFTQLDTTNFRPLARLWKMRKELRMGSIILNFLREK